MSHSNICFNPKGLNRCDNVVLILQATVRPASGCLSATHDSRYAQDEDTMTVCNLLRRYWWWRGTPVGEEVLLLAVQQARFQCRFQQRSARRNEALQTAQSFLGALLWCSLCRSSYRRRCCPVVADDRRGGHVQARHDTERL